jgi:cytochrome c6
MRRSKTLKLAALQRNGITSAQAVALIAENGVGRMGAYGSVLGEGGPEAVATYVWDQAQAGWPKV